MNSFNKPFIYLDPTILEYKSPTDMDKLANPHTKGMMEISSQKTEKTDSINPHGEQADACIGPMSVMAWMYIMYEDKFVDEAPIIFNIKEAVSLKDGFLPFVTDFAQIYQCVCKELNPEGKKLVFSRLQTSKISDKFYNWLPIDYMEDAYKGRELKKPEWLENFYLKAKEIQQIPESKEDKKSE